MLRVQPVMGRVGIYHLDVFYLAYMAGLCDYNDKKTMERSSY